MSPGRISVSDAGEPGATPATQMPEIPASSSTTAWPLMPSDSKSPSISLATTGSASSLLIAKNCDVLVSEPVA